MRGTRRAACSRAEALVKWIPPNLVERRTHARRRRAAVLRTDARGINNSTKHGIVCAVTRVLQALDGAVAARLGVVQRAGWPVACGGVRRRAAARGGAPARLRASRLDRTAWRAPPRAPRAATTRARRPRHRSPAPGLRDPMGRRRRAAWRLDRRCVTGCIPYCITWCTPCCVA